MLLQAIIYLPSIVVITTIALFTLLRRRDRILLFFSFMALSIAAWLLTQFFVQLNLNDSALFFVRLTALISNFLGYFFLIFVLQFQIFTQKIKSRKIELLLLIPPIFFSAISFSSLMINQVTVTDVGFAVESIGNMYFIQLACLATYLISGIVILTIDTIKKTKEQKTQNYYLLFGVSQAIIISLTVNAFFSTVAITQIFVVASLAVMVAFTAFAIIRHKLFDIRLVAVRAVTYLLSVGILATVYGFVAFRFADVVIGSWSIEQKQIFYIFLAIVLALTFAPLKRFFEKVTNSIFYRDHYDAEELINCVGRILAGEIELDVVAKEVVHEITRQMKISRGEIVVFGKSQIFYENDVFKANRAPISKQELRQLGPRLAIADDLQGGDRKEVMDRYGINVSVALRTKKQFLGYLLLSDKRSGDIYTQQDVRVLRTLGSEVSVAVQNALSYKEIQLFNETLSERVAQRTAQLRTANQQLHALDAAKDEFISMASHQLRTPLTTVKGYASMLEEGDFGKLTKEQRDKVDLTLDGANRMARLIDDLLNVSRMDANRFFLEVNEVDMISLVESELVQLQTMAESKKVKLSYTPPAEKLPLIRLDENKTRQVVMNLIDNAIHYGQPASGEAQVNVSMERDGSQLVFEVSDNGIGVPAAAQKHLFTKMFRADNAKDVRPDGTGLGLYLVKRVIEDQGGEIIFKSQEGKGSTFGFRLPLSGVPKSVEAKSRKISAKVAAHPK